MTATLRAAAEKALEALIESVDLVQNSYDTDWRHGLPTRAKQLQTSFDALNAHKSAINGLRAALAAPQPEPVDGVVIDGSTNTPALVKRGTERGHVARWGGSLLYASPQAREPLTPEQYDQAWTSFLSDEEYAGFRKRLSAHEVRELFAGFARAIERARGIGAKP